MNSSALRWRRLTGAGLALAAALAVGALVRQVVRPVEPESVQLFCGAALRPAMEQITSAFRSQTGIHVQTTYGASNLLLGQLTLSSGQADLFLPGDAYYVQAAAEAGLIEESLPVAWFVPAIMVRRGNPRGIATLADLARPDLRLALADERSAAIGRITLQLLAHNGLSMDHIRSNVVFTATTAPELAGAVALGHVDATIVWQAVAHQHEGEVVPIAPDSNVPAPLAVGMMRGTGRHDDARAFMAFLVSAQARQIFRAHHYSVEPPAGSGRPEP